MTAKPKSLKSTLLKQSSRRKLHAPFDYRDTDLIQAAATLEKLIELSDKVNYSPIVNGMIDKVRDAIDKSYLIASGKNLTQSELRNIYDTISLYGSLFDRLEAVAQRGEKNSVGESVGFEVLRTYHGPFQALKELCLSRVTQILADFGNLKYLEDKKAFIARASDIIESGMKLYAADDASRRQLWTEIEQEIFSTPSVSEALRAPLSAPDGEMYATHRKHDEDVVAFIDRVYGQRGYLTGEFTRADLRKIDPSAMTALNNWEKGNSTRPKSRAPLNLPTVAERNDRYVAQGEIVADDPKETARRAAAAVYRMTRKPKF